MTQIVDTHAEETTKAIENETSTAAAENKAGEATHAEETTTAPAPHISIKAEPLFHIGQFPVTNSLITSLIATVLFILMAVYYKSQIGKKVKSGGFYVIHAMVKAIYSLYESVLKEKVNVFFPLLGAFFMFILFNNWLGLIPGAGSLLVNVLEDGHHIHVPLLRAGTADLNTTLALALISVLVTQYFGLKYLGAKSHVGKYINVKGPIDFFVGIFEIVSEFSRVLSFSFRLFGNVLAGEVLLAILAFLLPSFVSFVATPMFFLEIFVGFIQALVFSMLTAVFINMAIHHH